MIRVSPNRADQSFNPQKRAAFVDCLVRCALVSALICSAPLHAHEGHDHGAEPAVQQQALAPRLTHASARLEVVALLQGHDLLVYADDYASNAPASGLRVDVRSAGRLVRALETEPGLYRAALQIESQARDVQLDLSLSGEGIAERFAGSLPIAVSEDAAQSSASPNIALIAGGTIAALLLAIAGAGWLLRKRRAA